MTSTIQVFEETIKTDHKVITEEESKKILKRYGVSAPPYALVNSADEAAKAASQCQSRSSAASLSPHWSSARGIPQVRPVP